MVAYQQSSHRESIVLIDDRIRDMVLSFRGLVEQQRAIAASICKRIALVAFGYEYLPHLPSRLPFPVVALPSWDQQLLHLAHAGHVTASGPLSRQGG